MIFNKEADFEEALIKILSEKGWEKEIIKYPTEKELVQNWANILFDNNRFNCVFPFSALLLFQAIKPIGRSKSFKEKGTREHEEKNGSPFLGRGRSGALSCQLPRRVPDPDGRRQRGVPRRDLCHGQRP